MECGPLVPPPRAHQVRYHGVFAPTSKSEEDVVNLEEMQAYEKAVKKSVAWVQTGYDFSTQENPEQFSPARSRLSMFRPPSSHPCFRWKRQSPSGDLSARRGPFDGANPKVAWRALHVSSRAFSNVVDKSNSILSRKLPWPIRVKRSKWLCIRPRRIRQRFRQ